MSNDTTQYTPADVRERVAFEAFAWEHCRRGAAAEWISAQWQDETPKRRAMYFDLADRILAILRTPRGEGERVQGAWATVEAAALARADMLDSNFAGQRAQAAEIRNAVEQVAALLRTPRGEGEAKPVAWRVEYRQRGVGDARWYHLSTYANEMDARERAKHAEAAMRVLECRIIPLYASPAAAIRSEAQGEEDVGEVCHLCGEEFDPRESGTVTGPLGEDDGVPRWYRCPRCARAYDAGYQQGQRDPRGDETADPTALRSETAETPRGDGEAKFDVGDPVALRLAASKLEASGYDVLPLRLRMIADQIKCVIAARRSKAQGDAEALAAADMERVPTPQEER